MKQTRQGMRHILDLAIFVCGEAVRRSQDEEGGLELRVLRELVGPNSSEW